MPGGSLVFLGGALVSLGGTLKGAVVILRNFRVGSGVFENNYAFLDFLIVFV